MSWPFIRTLVHREVVASTSDLARELIVAGEPGPPFAVRADRQTRGRGRGANRWWSDPGSLTFTIALDPAAHSLRVEHEPRLALATAVAVIDAIIPLGSTEPPGIRWPNDIEVGDRKLGGILPERVETPLGPRLLIGLGLNVASRITDAPPEIRGMAASLAEFRPGPTPPVDVERLLRLILEGFAAVLDRLAHDDPGLSDRWASLDTLRDRPVRVDLGPRVVSGVGRGIDPEGALRLATAEGEIRLFGGQVLRDVRPT
jgi:BirA family biotin operon repressor/biotin-[acetyl-CoA-carboxylase] ligase